MPSLYYTIHECLSLALVMVAHGLVQRNIAQEHVQYLEQIIFKRSMAKVIRFEVHVTTF